MGGNMNRTFFIYRVPSPGVGFAEKLCFKADPGACVFNRQAPEFLDNIPCGTARCTPDNLYLFNNPVLDCQTELRRTEIFPVSVKTVLPCQCTSGGGGQ